MNPQSGEIVLETPLCVYAILPACPDDGETFGTEAASDGLGTIVTGAFAAVVGDGPHGGDLGRKREDLAPKLLAHQRLLERLLQTTPVLPVKFGTFVPDERSVRVLLERGHSVFEEAFSRLKGCVQMEVLVKWNVASVFADIAKEEPVAQLKEKLGGDAGAQKQTLREGLGRLVKGALDRRRAELAASVSTALQQVALDAITYSVTSDQAVLHLVLLINAGEAAAFEHCLEALDAAHDGQLTFRCVGPLAPYNFATVEIEIVDAAALKQAMCLLDVSATTSAAEVRAAYRHLAKSVHPDVANANINGCTNMVALKEACRIVSLNAETACRQGDTEMGASCDVLPSADRSVHVSVRRQEQVHDAAA